MSALRPEFRSDLEGLRGVAILLVVLFHAGITSVAGGFVGVDIFFVLSGFFITGLLERETEVTGGINLTNFYAKRSLRLLPAMLVVLFTTLALVLWLYAPIDQPGIARNARAVAMYSGNMAFAGNSVDYFSSGENPLLHTWSLAVEQQFYMLWPLLFILVALAFNRPAAATSTFAFPESRRTTHKPLLIAVLLTGVVSFVASMLLTRSSQSWAFFGMPTRVWEFALGGALALLMNSRTTTGMKRWIWLQFAALVAIAFAVVTYDRSTPYPGVAALLPAFATIGLLVGGQYAPATSWISRVLSAAPFRWIGSLSYGWYLWHWPLVGLAGVLYPGIGVWGKLLWCAIALALGWLTLRYIEQPARNGKLSELPSGRIAVGTAVVTVAAVVLAHGALMIAERRMQNAQQQLFAKARESRVDHGCWAGNSRNPNGEPKGSCEFGDVHSKTTVVLFGDSHAEHWFGALDRVGKERGWKIVLMVMGGCPVAELPELKRSGIKSYYDACKQFREATVQRIIALKPTVAVLSSFDHYVATDGEASEWKSSPTDWENGLRRTYSRLSGAGIPVVAVRGTPRTGFSVPQCLSRLEARQLLAKPCEYDLQSSLIPSAVAAQTNAARGLRVNIIDMNDVVCTATPCQVMGNGIVVFTDDNHLTYEFSRSVAPVFGARIVSAANSLGSILP